MDKLCSISSLTMRKILNVKSSKIEENEYNFFANDEKILTAKESSSSGQRQFFSSAREFDADFVDANGDKIFSIHRPRKIVGMEKVEVRDVDGKTIGTVEQKMGLSRKFDLVDSRDKTLARATGFSQPKLDFKSKEDHTFEIKCGDKELGSITRIYTKREKKATFITETFDINFDESSNGDFRALVLALAVVIDFVCYEKRDHNNPAGALAGAGVV